MAASKLSILRHGGYASGWSARVLSRVIIFCFVAGSPLTAGAQAPRSPTPQSLKDTLKVQTVAKGFEHPWSLAFLPDKRILVTERPGRLRGELEDVVAENVLCLV